MKIETTQFTIMLGKSSKPAAVIEKIIAGPLSPINQSPRGLKSFDAGGVGLGIVAALEKPGSASSNKALFARNLSRSNPVPVRSATEEDYTVVTCHEPSNSCTTKVYATAPFRLQSSNIRASVFHISPAKIGESAGVPPPDFLSACNLCRKGLHGVDIYMYRGEKAFCSPECRYREMAMDERAEKCRSEAARPPVEAASASASSNSPNYNNANGQILTNGILAI